ncbi:MAG: 2-dehydro-3-deoxygalactonokinase [Sulfitobacter sp.]
MWVAVDIQARGMRVWVHDQDAVIPLEADLGVSSNEPLVAVLGRLLLPYVKGAEPLLVLCSGASDPASFAPVPVAPPNGGTAVQVQECDPRMDLRAISGVGQARPSDFLSGEETAVAGFIAAHPKWDGVLCITGNHSKWVHISAGEIVSFQTFMTTEMFELLAQRSSLAGDVGESGWDSDAFALAVSDAMSRPEKMTATLFSLHADAVLKDPSPAVARARLFGMLVGMELAAARPYWLGQNVAVIGTGDTADHYVAALKGQGVIAPQLDRDKMGLEGLRAAFMSLQTNDA